MSAGSMGLNASSNSHRTNPLGASPLAVKALRQGIENLHIYPNSGLDLRRVLAETYETKIENVVVGSGSDAIMANIIRTFLCDDDEVLTTEAATSAFKFWPSREA